MKRKLQVFVSSTYTDMLAERQAAIEEILICEHIPAGMELFSADNDSQFKVIKNWIRACDVFILILGGRYGSKDRKTGRSYIHLEYNYAKHIGKKPIVLVLSDNGINQKVAKGEYKIDDKEFMSDEYKEFKDKILKNKLIAFFEDPSSLKICINHVLRNIESKPNYAGWVRFDEHNSIANRSTCFSSSNLNDAITNAIKK